MFSRLAENLSNPGSNWAEESLRVISEVQGLNKHSSWERKGVLTREVSSFQAFHKPIRIYMWL